MSGLAVGRVVSAITGTVGGLEILGVSWTGAGYTGLEVSAKGGMLGGLDGLGGETPGG